MTAPVRPPSEIFSLAGRTVVVTGASAGIGQRFARVLAEAGAQVVAAARRPELLGELAERHESIHPVVCDVADEADRARLIDQASEIGVISVLVNNAATSGASSTDDEDASDFARVLDVNLVAAYDLSRRTIARTEAPGLSIVNISSILGMVTGAPLAGAAYAASKAELIGLTRELAGQWARRGVRVNAIAPGWFETDMTADLLADDSSARWLARQTLMRRAGTVDELDGLILYLASDASSFCTGQVHVVDGGWTAR